MKKCVKVYCIYITHYRVRAPKLYEQRSIMTDVLVEVVVRAYQ